MNTQYIDTHGHLNFKRFHKTREDVIQNMHRRGVGICIVPGADIVSSQKAVEIATTYNNLYAAVGIHPHHTLNSHKVVKTESQRSITSDIQELEKLIIHPKVVAVGEIGLDKHVYEETKYPSYKISDAFFTAQKEYFVAQVQMAVRYKKSLILHNRETKKELIELLDTLWIDEMRYQTVFHCCEPDRELLTYAVAHNIYLGVDGDITYGGEKAEFIKYVPLTSLVLETDSPFLLPEPLKTQRLYPNTPANIPLIAQCVADLKGISVEEVGRVTTANAKRLFNMDIQPPAVSF